MTSRMLFAALFVIGAAWGLTTPLSKYIVLGGYRHFGIVFWQQVVAVAVLGFWLIVARRPVPLSPGSLARYAFIAMFGTILPGAAFYTAQEGLPAGLVALFIALVPMFALPLAIGLRLERPEPLRFLGILAGLAGIAMIILPEASLPDRAALVFVPFALAAPVFYAAEATGLGRLGTDGLDPVQLLFGASFIGLVLVLPFVWASGSWITPSFPMGRAGASLVVTALIHAVAYSGYVWIVGHGGAVFAAQVSYIITGTGILWSVAILGERYSLWIWGALGIVFAGLFLVQPRPARSGDGSLLALPLGEGNIPIHEPKGH
ncbi:DMT family transporter [Defluviimonas sp. SAOS-178_SWC]|uniref:DMT family transporter n=1 Tax=Defluviimonas sp. SAOS-178_SWC TaxID=3121287 RepID=UPI003221D645